MKGANKNVIEVNTWQQVRNKIKKSDSDRRRERESFAKKVNLL
jgi:hypothetical protein